MKTIVTALRTGDAVKRLAIAADLFSIIGVSVATIVGAFLTVPKGLSAGVAVQIAALALLSLAGLAVVFAVVIFISAAIKEMFGEYRPFHWALQFALWAVFVALLLWSGYFVAVVVDNSFLRPN